MSSHHFIITRISDGLAFGHGAISGQDDQPELLAQVDHIIHESGDLLVPISHDDNGMIEDDGCGDGREVASVFRRHETLKRSLDRPKVFGGSTAMAAASLIGTGSASGRSLNEVFVNAVDLLRIRDIDFGAHTDEHASGENCGCGAIDKAPETVLATLKYEKPIRDVLLALGTDTDQLDDVYHHFREYVHGTAEAPLQDAYSGRQVMDKIIGENKVVKQLGGTHRERRIILNTVRNYTVNQELVRDASEGRVQAFAVDLWRLEETARKLFPDNERRQAQAYLSELLYTLAVAAVLTKGDLPVYMTRERIEPAIAA